MYSKIDYNVYYQSLVSKETKAVQEQRLSKWVSVGFFQQLLC